MSLIEKIKAIFAEEQVSEAKFLDAKLVDGTIVRVEGDAFKVGDKLSVITEAGEVVNAPEGMHELEDGSVLVVDAEGMITEVRQPEVKAEEAEDVPVEEVPAEQMAEAEIEVEAPEAEVAPEGEDRVAALEAKVAELEQALILLIESIQGQGEMMSKLKAENEAIKIENEKLSKVPAAKPVATRKFEKVETVNEPKTTSRIAELLEKNKK